MKNYIMIGAPVTTVRTPPLLADYLARAGIEARIEIRHLEPDDLHGFMKTFMSDPGIDGLMVTMPHKKTILPYMDRLSDAARLAGSVNAVKRLTSGELAGAQFDGAGLVNALLEKGAPLTTARVLLAGAGGAGLAIAQALLAHGCRSLAIAETNRDLLDRALSLLRAQSPCPVAGANETGAEYDLLINATPLGMGADDPSPFGKRLVAHAAVIADIVADPPETRLAALARAAGVVFVTGRDMVKGQVAPIGDWLMHDDAQH